MQENLKSKGVHIFSENDENQVYPQAKKIFLSKNIIIDELKNKLFFSKNWTNWLGYDQVGRNESFTKLPEENILQKISQSSSKLGEGPSKWKIFGLILNGKVLEQNVKECPMIFKLLKECGNFESIVNVGISCFEPYGEAKRHRDYNKSFYRVQIPLIIPEGDCGIIISKTLIRWKMNEYFIFDDTFFHEAWNRTPGRRFVMLLDLKRV